MKRLIIGNDKMRGVRGEIINSLESKGIKISENTFKLGDVEMDLIESARNFRETLDVIFIKEVPEIIVFSNWEILLTLILLVLLILAFSSISLIIVMIVLGFIEKVLSYIGGYRLRRSFPKK